MKASREGRFFIAINFQVKRAFIKVLYTGQTLQRFSFWDPFSNVKQKSIAMLI